MKTGGHGCVLGSFSLAALFAALPLAPVRAAGPVEVVLQLDAASGDSAEGIAIDKRGNIFLSISALGEIHKVDRSGIRTVFATLDTTPGGGPAGLAVDAPGNVYAALISDDPDTHGVWFISRDGQDRVRLPGTGQIVFPNALVFDEEGDLYVTDSFAGAIWRILADRDDDGESGAGVYGQAEVWLDDPLLAGFDAECPFGANGIAYRHGELVVAVPCQTTIVSIPMLPNGGPGPAEVLFYREGWEFFPDGITLDVHGNIYAANVWLSEIVRISRHGHSAELLAVAADGLDDPTSLTFGTGRGDRRSLFVTNHAYLDYPYGSGGASVVKIDVGVPGRPLP